MPLITHLSMVASKEEWAWGGLIGLEGSEVLSGLFGIYVFEL